MIRLLKYLCITLAALSRLAVAVDCTPGEIMLSTQTEVNDFQSNHGPGCDTIVTSLTISGASITDLSPLSGLTTMSWASKLVISDTGLVNLTGLQGLQNIHWFELLNNTALTDISALSSVIDAAGPIFIDGNTALGNLVGLENINTLPFGALFIENNSKLSDLGGISNIQSINASLVINNNDMLTNLDDLAGLQVVNSNINISYNDALTNIAALSGLIDFTETLYLRFNSQLNNLGTLQNLTDLGGLVIHANNALNNLDGLENLRTIGDNTALGIYSNNALTDIDALSGVVSAEFDVEVADNPLLTQCAGLKTLLDATDDALPGPGPGVDGIPDVQGEITIENNGTGCNSVEDIVGVEPPPASGASFHYGGFGSGNQHLLFKGLNVSQSCLPPSISLPGAGQVLATRLDYACSIIPYGENETLIYDVVEDRCQTLGDYSISTNLDVHGVYLDQGIAGAPLDQQTDVVFKYDPQALLLFDPQSGELQRQDSMICPEGEPPPPPPPPPGVLGQLDFLKAHNAGQDDTFGDQVAVSGDTVVVATRNEDGSATTIDGADDDNAPSAGAAYVFVRTAGTDEWEQQAYLKASNGESGDKFGSDIAIDGDTIVVGAENEDGDSNSRTTSGAAYVFVRNGTTWTEQQILRASDAANGDWFGSDVAISGDTIVVGAWKENQAFVFTRTGGVWTQQQILTGSNTESGDSFGRDVTIDGDTIVVGAFAEDSAATGINGDEEDNSASANGGAGAAYVFLREAGTWSQQAYLKASNTDAGDQFGGKLSLSGETLAVGAYHERSNATGINGDQANNSTEDAGAVYVFVRNGSVWSQQAYLKASNTGFQDRFGSNISVSGNFLVAAASGEDGEGDEFASGAGAVYAFEREGPTWSQFAYLKASNLDTDDWFGRDLGLSGTRMVVGAFYEDSDPAVDQSDNSLTNSGAAYVFNVTDNIPDPGEDTTPPVVTPPVDIDGVEATGLYTPVALGEAVVTDDSGESLTAGPDFTGPFQLGTTQVTWSATDSAGNTGTANQQVTITDTTNPVVVAPADISLTANGAMTRVTLGVATTSDNAGPVQSLLNDAPELFPVGVTVVTWTATDASGNTGTDTQTIDVSPPEITAPWVNARPEIDGFLASGEWDDANRFYFPGGFLAFMHRYDRLYVLIDVLDDDGDDAFRNGGGDQFWLHFDIDEDGVASPGTDLRYRLESGTGNLRLQTFCDGCPGGFDPLEAMTFSARGEGFGCFVEDGSASFIPLRCNSHRVWELALDLAELEMRSDRSTRLGYLVASGSPLLSDNYPTDLNNLADYISLTLERVPRQKASSGPGSINPMFEVTQGIQTTINSVDLVAGKPATVRIWDSSNENTVMNFIFGARNGVDLPGSPLLDVSDLYDSYGPDDPRDTVAWNSTTTLPETWTEGGSVDFDIQIQGLDDSPVATMSRNIDFAYTRTPVFWTVPIRNNFPDFAFTLASGAQITAAEQLLQRSAPIEEIDFVRRPVLNVNNVNSSAGLIQALKAYDQLVIMAWNTGLAANGVPPFDLPEQITGFNTTGFGTVGGSSDRVGKGGNGRITWVSLSARMMTYAHEINHNADRATNSTWGLHSRGCNASSGGPLDQSWPYGSSFLIQEAGVFPRAAGGFSSVNDQTPDLMSYCAVSSNPTTWWSPYRWQAWVDEFSNPAPTVNSREAKIPVDRVQAGAEQAGLPATSDSFYLMGRVYPDDSGEITQVLRQPGIPDAEGITGDYSVRVLDCSNATLAGNSFPVDFLGDEGEDHEFVSFGFILPAPIESCSIELLLNEMVLDSRTISANAPTVAITSPNGGEEWSGIETVQWTADDLDGDPLLFTLFYSADGGMSWQPIATMIDALEYDIDSTELPGSADALIRVLATDGGNTTADDSDALFNVNGRQTEVAILSPAHGDSFPSTSAIELSGMGRDTNGRAWPEDGLLWSTSGGVFANGSKATVTLDEGVHPIALIAMDGLSIAALEVIEITVSDAPTEISFDSPSYTVSEEDGLVTIGVVRTGSSEGPAAVLYSTQDGEAISGGDPVLGEDDYIAITVDSANRLEWGDGEVGERFFSVVVNQDGVVENSETFQVLLEGVSGETLDLGSATVIITSGDSDTIFSDGFE